MQKLKTTWPRFRKALFSVIFIHSCFFMGLLSIMDINFTFDDRLATYLKCSQFVASIVSVYVARWILFIKKEKDESPREMMCILEARENEMKKIVIKDVSSDLSEKNFFSIFAMLFCFLAIFYIVDNTSFIIETYYSNGKEVLGNLQNFVHFEFPYAFSLFLFISALIFIKNFFVKKKASFFVDVLIIAISIFVILYYLKYLNILFRIVSLKDG